MDKGCVTIAGAYRKASEAASLSPSPAAAIASSHAYAGTNSSRVGLTYAGTEHAPFYTSKEASMAAVCRQVAVQGFEPISDVFSLKEW